MVRLTGRAAAVAMTGVAGLHVAWGLGSSFPFRDRSTLADAVAGTSAVPPRVACFGVAAALTAAAGLALDLPIAPARLRRLGRAGAAAVLGARGLVGLAGRTDLLSPGSSSPAFRRLDRRYYAPLCLALAAATATAVTRR